MNTKSDPRIVREFVDLARERGCGLTEAELRAEGYTDSQIAVNGNAAARQLRETESRRAA